MSYRSSMQRAAACLLSFIRRPRAWLLVIALLALLPNAARAACGTMNVPDAYTTPSTSPMASGTSITIDASRCDAFGLNPYPGPGTTNPTHGTVSVDTVAGSITYTNIGDGATSDSFVVKDASNIAFTVNVAIGAAVSPITVSPASLLTPLVGVSYSQTLSATGGTAPYSYAVTSGTLPPGLGLGGATISGTPHQAGNYTATLTVTDNVGTTSTKSYTVTVPNPSSGIAIAAPATAFLNTPYSHTLAASGALAPYTFSLNSGSLPTGMALASNGTLSGTPTATGTYNFNVVVTDSSPNLGGSSPGPYFKVVGLSLTVQNLPPPVTNPMSATVAYGSTNNPITLNITGGTPASVAVGTAAAHGTASASGTSITYTPASGYAGPDSFTYTATNSGGTSAPATATITVSPPSISYTPSSPAVGTVGTAYSRSLASASGGTAPYTYTIASGSLPAGLALASNGTLSGTPTAGGNFNFTVTATDNSTGTGPFSATSGTLTLTVDAPTISITPVTLSNPTVGIAYSRSVAASGGTGPYTYALTNGSLPVGLSFSSDGTLSGTPTTAGTFFFTMTATDSSTGAGPYAGSRAYVFTVAAPAMTLAPAAGTTFNGTAGSSVSGTFTAANGTAPYTYAISAGALPPGVTLSSAGALSGTPTAAGNFSFTVLASDSSTGAGAPFTASGSYTLAVAAPTITIAPLTLGNPTVGAVYSQSITASGGIGPYSYAVTAGTLPVGLSFDSSGTLSGTPSAAGSFNFTITATDTGGFTGSRAYSVTVGAGTVVLAPAALANATAETPYTRSFAASGGTTPYAYTLTAGALPAGLTLSSAGVLSGTPTVAGSFNFTVTATDSSTGSGAPFTDNQAYALTVDAPTITLTPATLPASTGGAAYSQTLGASGGDGSYTYSVTAGALPAGITLSSAGDLSGTPSTTGSYNFTITATDGHGFSGSQAYAFSVNAPTITIAPLTLGNPTVGAAYSQSVTASGGIGPYSYAVTAGTLPVGLSFASSGTLSGTPSAAGSFNFTVTATDGGGFTGSRAYSVTVGAGTVVLAPAALANATAETPYTRSFAASGGTTPYAYTLTAGALPAGLTLSSAGVLSGTPTVAGSFNFTVTATDSSTGSGAPFTDSQAYALTVEAPTITLTPATLPAGTGGAAYSQTLGASGGDGSYVFSVAGTLPPGLALSSTGTVSGTPTTAGSFNFTVTATDGLGFSGSQAYTLGINQPAPVAVNDTATTSANAPVTIAASANDTGPITSIAVAQAPAHGTATVSGLDVVYTPTSNFFGSDSFTYTATGPGGSSTPATVSVTVTPLAVPVAAAQSVTVLAGASVTIHAATGASNGPFTAATVASAPTSGTTTVQGTDIVYVAVANASGTVGFDYTLSNAFGASQPAHVTVTINPRPVAPALTAATTAGTTVQVDLTAGARGGPFTDAGVVSISPTNAGSATIKTSGDGGYTLAFTSAATFGGVARITYTLSNAFATSAPGTVDVTVKLRSDPSKDTEVLGVLEAQAEAARRMAMGQIGNFQRRLESLHGGGSRAGFSNGISMSSASSQRRNDPLLGMQQQVMGGGGDPFLMPADVPATDRTAADSSTPDGLAFWAGGAVNFGKLKPGSSYNGVDFTTSGLSLGADKQVTQALALGLGVGYGHDASDIGQHGSRSTVDSYNVAAYGSYRPGESAYVDALVGYQWLQFDARRFVTDNGNTVRGSRDGKQWFASFSVGYRHQADDMMLTPYGRLDVARATLDGYTENGDAVFALNYRSQTVRTSTGTVGLLMQWTVKRDYGVWAPQLRAEFGHDMQGSSQATMRYADQLSGPLYQATLARQSRNHTLLGAGIALQTLKGWSLRAEYQNQLDNTSRGNQSILLSVQKTLPP